MLSLHLSIFDELACHQGHKQFCMDILQTEYKVSLSRSQIATYATNVDESGHCVGVPWHRLPSTDYVHQVFICCNSLQVCLSR